MCFLRHIHKFGEVFGKALEIYVPVWYNKRVGSIEPKICGAGRVCLRLEIEGRKLKDTVMKKKITLLFTALAVCAALLSGCGNAGRQEGLCVYTSFYAMYDFARMIGGGRASVTSLVPAGVEPHDWEPSAADMAKLSQADVLILNGAGMEHWAESLEGVLEDTRVVYTCDAVETDENTDPHTWLSPKNAELQLEAVADAFCEADPENADFYRQNLDGCKKKAELLDSEYRSAGLDGMTLIVSHEAYGYLCREYGMEQLALDNGAGTGDPSPARLAEAVTAARDTGAKYIYYDPSDSPAPAEAVAKDAGCKTLPLSAFENDGEDRSYFEVMEENLENLRKNL